MYIRGVLYLEKEPLVDKARDVVVLSGRLCCQVEIGAPRLHRTTERPDLAPRDSLPRLGRPIRTQIDNSSDNSVITNRTTQS